MKNFKAVGIKRKILGIHERFEGCRNLNIDLKI